MRRGRSGCPVPMSRPGVAPGIIPLLAHLSLGVGRRARTEGRTGDAMILPGTRVARDEGGGVLPGPDEIAGGRFPAKVKDARGFEIGLVGPRA
jgi:hypothetical protein